MRPRLALLAACVLTMATTPESAHAQRDLPPEKGGLTYELGMPPIYKGRAGFELGWSRPAGDSDLAGFYTLGLARDLGSPVVGIAALRLEGYIGLTSEDLDGGGRALFEIPSFHLGLGVDYDGPDDVLDPIYTLDLPLRRGGLFGRGSTLAIRWLPSRDQSFSVGVNVPLWGRNLGATRPRADHVRLDRREPRRLEADAAGIGDELAPVLADLAERATWVCRLAQPFAEPGGADPVAAMAPIVADLRAHLDSTSQRFPDGHTLPAEIAAYHRTLALAFALAAGQDAGREAQLARRARAILLEEVLLPYNALLGQRKTNDSLVGMVAIAQSEFARWVLGERDLAPGAARRVFFVFQTLCDILEARRQELRQRWEDSRLVWLPLQLALTPDQHDTQAELDDLVARAAGRPFTRHNRVWYVVNEEFQWEMARSVRAAEDYHVLWVHDYRGRNGDGDPDALAFGHTVNYLEALCERVAAYDDVGKLPQYFLFLDQHYFEVNGSRLFLRLLLDPLGHQLSLPADFADWEDRIRALQDRLRAAVDASQLLRMRASQYGRRWLENQIKVHVSVTNPADPSFFSWHVAGILPVPDNLMRDHRKIAFYDVTEQDPYRGMALFTGMGIGEHYVGAGWEDRAIMIQGPGALAVKDAARELLQNQGYAPHEIPYPLRRVARPVSYQASLAREAAANATGGMGDRGGVLQLHNETGFHDKPINASKAVLYSLLPPGSVLQVPDSLWQSYVYASLLAGSTLRGCRVLVIAPTRDTAPSAAAPTLARAHGLLGRLIAFSGGMERHLRDQGGRLEVGLYAPRQGVADIAGRFEQALANRPAWAGEIFPPNPTARRAALGVAALLDSLGHEEAYLAGDDDARPKIHLKANFLASGAGWQALLARPELASLIREYAAYQARQVSGRGGGEARPDVRDVPERLSAAWLALIENLMADLDPARREELIYYFSVGSTNMDYRSMVMDGEVQVLVGGWQALSGFLDFLLLPGLCEWVETRDQLDALLPPPGALTRHLAGLMKLSL